MLIEPNHPAANYSPRQFWEEELRNCLILLADINARIHSLEIENYSIDTGQTSESVRRSALNSLTDAREKLLRQIRDITAILQTIDNTGNNFFQVVPF
jgi:hypothetical protein